MQISTLRRIYKYCFCERSSSPREGHGSAPYPFRGGFRLKPRLHATLLLMGCLGLGFSPSTALLGQTPPQNPPGNQPGNQGGGGQGKKIRVQGDTVIFAVEEEKGVPFLQFVKFVQKITHKTFYIDTESDPTLQPDSPTNQIRLLGTMRIKKDKLFGFFQTVLFIKGWAIIPRGKDPSKFYQIVKIQTKTHDVKKGAIFVPPDELENYKDKTGSYIITTLRLKNINASLAAANLRAFHNDPLGIDQMIALGDSSGQQKALMLAGFAPSVYTLSQLLRLVDIKEEAPKASLRTIRLQYMAPEDIVPILDQLVAQKKTGAQPAGQGTPNPEDLVPIKIMVVPNSNRIIIHAHEKKIREIENIVARLDTKIETFQGNYHVYRLRNTLAKDIRKTLRDFFQQASTAQRQSNRGGGAPGASRASSQTEPPPVIIDDEKSNSLLISASKSQYEKVSELVKKLDVRQPQVLIEAALIELGTQDVDKLGIELGLLDIGGKHFTRPFGFTSYGLTTFQDTDGNGLPDTRLPDFENPLQGITGGILSSDDFAIPVIVNALKSDTTANVLSIPSVLVNNNEDALVTSKDSFPTTRSQTGNVTTQTDFSGFQDAGIDLAISPSISEGNYVKLNIKLEVSKFTGSFDSSSAVPPPKTVRTIQTVVTIPSGNTMVFGGVIEDQSSETNDGIPFLKDLPILGILFRKQETTKRKTNLYFFLTPHILDEEDFSDLSKLTFEKKLEASKYIGHRRLKILDPKWKGEDSYSLEDPASTIEDLDKLGGFEIPTYVRPPAGETKPDGASADKLHRATKSRGKHQ